MKFLQRTLIAAAYCCGLAFSIAAQTVSSAGTVSEPVRPSGDALPSDTLAMVNDRPVTLSDIDPKIRQMVEGLDADIAKARQGVLDNQINSVLIEAAARKNNQLNWQLYDAEVTNRIVNPTEQDVKAFYETNREQMGTMDFDAARPQIITYLKNQQQQTLASELAAKLRAGNPVTLTDAKPNAAQFAPGTVVATVAGQSITAGALGERLKPVIYKLRLNAYLIEKAGVNKAIDDMLLLAEASRRNIAPEEIIRKEITDKLHQPTEAEITQYYNENKKTITGSLESHRAEIATYLQQQEQVKLESALSTQLRAGNRVSLFLREPDAPRLLLSTAGSPSRGDVNAAVTVVEFTDFQCPACGKMYPVIEEALKPFGDRVHFVVRNFPLQQHPFAPKAAEAAMEANAQGKFFQYIALLFTNQEALDIPSLKKYATAVGMDRARFDAALDRGLHVAEVRHDMEDGQTYGVDSTPAIFVNGVRIQEYSTAGIKGAIDSAMARK